MFYPASGFEMVGKAHLDLAGIHVAQLLVKYAIVLILLSLSSIVVVLYFTLLSRVSLNQKKRQLSPREVRSTQLWCPRSLVEQGN